MNPELQSRLKAMVNRATRYELVMVHAITGQRLRICYTARRNRSGLVDAIRSHGPDLVRVTGAEEFKVGIGATATLADWSILFSGRTQREAISSGAELRWFAATSS